MSEDDKSPTALKDKESTLLFTKDGQKYYLNKSGGLDSRNVVTPHETESASYDMDDPDEESDMLDTSDPRDTAASPEELNDEEASEGDNAPKQCTYEGCTETTTMVAKQRKPWMCKKHRNKMYKDKYKKKKNDQALSSGKLDFSCQTKDWCGNAEPAADRIGSHGRIKKGSAGAEVDTHIAGLGGQVTRTLQRTNVSFTSDGPSPAPNAAGSVPRAIVQIESAEERPVSVNKQRLGSMGDRPARPSLIEQVLNQKRLSLLRSPEVISFLQQQQQLLVAQNRSQSQPQFPGC